MAALQRATTLLHMQRGFIYSMHQRMDLCIRNCISASTCVSLHRHVRLCICAATCASMYQDVHQHVHMCINTLMQLCKCASNASTSLCVCWCKTCPSVNLCSNMCICASRHASVQLCINTCICASMHQHVHNLSCTMQSGCGRTKLDMHADCIEQDRFQHL